METDTPGPNPLFAVWRLARVVEPLVEDAVEGMTAGDFGLLSQLRYGPPLSLSELADAVGSPLSTISQHVARLAQRGEVELRPNPDDGRSRLVALTTSGRAAHEAASHGFVAALERVRGVLGADEPAVLAALARLEEAVRRARSEDAADVPDARDAPDARLSSSVPAPLSFEQRAEVQRFSDYVRWRDASAVS